MGKRDSSLTRVKPVFDYLLEHDSTGGSWLAQLLAMPSGVSRQSIARCSPLTQHRWAPREQKLKPPRDLLRWLVEHLPPQPKDAFSDSETGRKRAALSLRDRDTIHEALGYLDQSALRSKVWYVLEGPSQPDIYLATDDFLVVVEGKRTESGPTTHTKWMPVRHQMLRHIDAAFEVRGSKAVLGFFIVEGEPPDSCLVPPAWLTAAAATVSPDVLASSLPHRSQPERDELAKAFIGVTTWQRVCAELGVPTTVLIDEIPDFIA
ncbi:MAG: hypothetical protein KY476_11945 [Planctomycetes bacterium]|nr:hypothetical protein [Planctomycetota bacterium]